jgi:hypothetical protein
VDLTFIDSISDIPEATRAEIGDLVTRLDQVRFAPVSPDGEEMKRLIEEVETILKKADREWED